MLYKYILIMFFIRFRMSYLTPLILLIILSSCGQKLNSSLPGITPEQQGVYHPGKFVWFELVTDDADAGRLFYTELFGWTYQDSVTHKKYSTIVHNGMEIGGILSVSSQKDDIEESRWICSISVDNVDEAANKVRSLGGEILYGPVDSGERGRLAQTADSRKADFILLRARNGDPKPPVPVPGNPIWVELFTRDKKESVSFYTDLFDYKVEQSEGSNHYYFTSAGKLRGGLTPIKWDDVKSTWLPFIGVANLKKDVLKAIESLDCTQPLPCSAQMTTFYFEGGGRFIL